MFDINKTIMRCLVKNLSLFGLGLYIYQGEDMPNDDDDSTATTAVVVESKKTTRRSVAQPAAPVVADRFAPIKNAINSVPDTDALLDLYLQHQNEVEGNPEIKALFTERKLQLRKTA